MPPAEAYEGFPQLENGVGLTASMAEEFDAGIVLIRPARRQRRVMVATGQLAEAFIVGLAARIEEKAPGVHVAVYAVRNDFFGGGVNVAGLVTGGDLIRQLRDKPKADRLLIPASMLRDGEDVFLDDVTLTEAEQALQMKIETVSNDGYEFIEKVLGEELDFSLL